MKANPHALRPGEQSSLSSVVRGTFSNIDDLDAWLQSKGVDTAAWGKGKAKHVSDLMSEVHMKVRRARARLGTATFYHIVSRRPPRCTLIAACRCSQNLGASFPGIPLCACRRAPSSCSAARCFVV